MNRTRSILLLILFALSLTIPSMAFSFTLDAGDILISDHGSRNIQHLDISTGTVTTLATTPSTPIGLAFDTNYNLYINNGTGIHKLDRATDTLTPFFTGVGQREGLTFDPTTGHFFSVSFGGNRIEEVDLAGNLVRTITIPSTSALLGISVRGNQLVVSDYGTGKIFLGTTTGSSFTHIGTLSANNTYAVDIDAAGNIYANDFALGKMVQFSLVGGSWVATDYITGLVNPANGLSIGDDGSFTISEYGLNAVSVWNSDGTFRQRFTGISNPDELVVFAPQRQNPIPEPATLALLGGGLISLVGLRRRRKTTH